MCERPGIALDRFPRRGSYKASRERERLAMATEGQRLAPQSWARHAGGASSAAAKSRNTRTLGMTCRGLR
ncbi:uncharacterized protein SOCE836_099280 [Sorangium cellulosum]|uniref:Uncharacterized protein n=1 Tax=Sorangium cellulosum TaxID=56 RepID=A0A4P2R4M2_SORCE|nr:uncharacterized protein SOCE836_099280 [Sorangium cellulosum]WCQ96986.1 hypothetical protein NQZ70_09776 [Sorangium sp. Soce836]